MFFNRKNSDKPFKRNYNDIFASDQNNKPSSSYAASAQARKKTIRITIIAILCIIPFVVFAAVRLSKTASKNEAGILQVIPGKNGAKQESKDEASYGADLYDNSISEKDKEKLEADGTDLSDDARQPINTFEQTKKLYGAEYAVQSQFMYRCKSPYKSAKEPSKSQRQRILDNLLNSFKKQDYEDVVSTMQNYLAQYTFEEPEDEPVTSLYHDALARVPASLKDSEAAEQDSDLPGLLPDTTLAARKSLIENSIGNRFSAIGTLYDTFTLSQDLVLPNIISNESCMSIYSIASIEESNVYDPQDDSVTSGENYQAIPFRDAIDADADVVYVYKIKDSNDNNVTVVIESQGILKSVVGVYYEDQQYCILKTSFQ